MILNDFIYIIEQHGYAEGYPIKIDRVIEQLQKMKNAGCNYIEMDYHCDHIGYQFSGFLIEEATIDQIEEFLNKKKEKEAERKKQAMLRELRQKIKEIEHGKYRKRKIYNM
jgi:hypothetical protein